MAKCRLKPLDDRVVVQQDQAEEKTAGGIVLPDAAQEKPYRGKVLAVGPGKLSDTGNRGPLSVRVGDTVLYGRYSGAEVDISGKEFQVVRESDILAVIE
ncbi:MAG: co-chaperone GroES [Phycisphaerae bacterium]